MGFLLGVAAKFVANVGEFSLIVSELRELLHALEEKMSKTLRVLEGGGRCSSGPRFASLVRLDVELGLRQSSTCLLEASRLQRISLGQVGQRAETLLAVSLRLECRVFLAAV